MKAFNAAGLSFPWRLRAGPRKGELDWKPLAHHVVLRILHNPAMPGRSPSGGTATSGFRAGNFPAPRCRGRPDLAPAGRRPLVAGTVVVCSMLVMYLIFGYSSEVMRKLALACSY